MTYRTRQKRKKTAAKIKIEPPNAIPHQYSNKNLEEADFLCDLDKASRLSEEQSQPKPDTDVDILSEAMLDVNAAERLLQSTIFLTKVFRTGSNLQEWLMSDCVLSNISTIQNYFRFRRKTLKWYPLSVKYFESQDERMSTLPTESIVSEMESIVSDLQEAVYSYPENSIPEIFKKYSIFQRAMDVEEVVEEVTKPPVHEVD
jgi:hypothetical protein